MAGEFDDSFSFLDEPLKNEGKRVKATTKRKHTGFDDAFATVERRAVRKATQTGQSVQAGRYEQLTFRLEPEIIDEIKAMAFEEGVSQEEMKRWIVYVGVLAYRNGHRPETETKVVRKRVKNPLEDENI